MKPLSGVRIIEFDGLGPVTFAGMVLADLGAEVLRLSRAEAGAFGEVGNDVLHRARNAVVVDLKSPADRDRVLDLIGDTPLDVQAARANGLKAVAVATGWVSADELAAAGADLVLPDFSDTDAAVTRLEALL